LVCVIYLEEDKAMIGLKLGTLNIGKPNKTGRLEELIDIMKGKEIGITGLNERIVWNKEGRK
jgi:hypothetical protein